MPDDTTILSLPLILPAQAQKHVTHNEALVQLDLIVQLTVINRTLTTAPALPSVGDRHIVALGATGPWVGQSGRIALYTVAGWQFTQPLPGWRAHVLAEGQTAVFDGLVWKSSSEGPLSVTQLGVSATADATNRLAVSAPATLLNHAGSGHQLKLNKSAAGDTASLLFQTGFGGRAEMGTAGSDDFSVKVSADGAIWFTVLDAEAATGELTLPQPLHLGGQVADPAAPVDGTLWLNTTTGEVKVRSAGVTLAVGSGGGGVTDGDKGDITVSGSGATWEIDAGAVTLTKLADIVSDSLLGRDTAGTGVPEVLTPAQARGILNVADGATANASDASLRDRATHTGTQGAGTITGLSGIATSGSAADLTAGTLPAARFDDTAHGSRAGGTLHAAATSSVAGFMAAADKVKLDAITGTNTGDQTITLTGDVTGSGTGSFAAGIANNAVTFAKMADLASDRLIGRDTAGTGDPEAITVGGGIEFTGSGGVQTSAFTGEVTKTAGGTVLTIANDAVTNAKLADMGANTIKGNNTGAAADPADLSGTQVTALLDTFSSGAKGLAPASGGGTTNFLRADGTWAAPAGGGGGSGDVVGPASATDNALARFDTTTGKLIQNGVNLASDAGEIGLPNVASPAVAPASTVNIFGSKIAGMLLPGFKGPTGGEGLLQPFVGFGQWSIFEPAGGTTTSQIGMAVLTAGTVTSAAYATGSRRNRLRRLEYLVTTAATNAVAGWRNNNSSFSVGGASSWEGGFYGVMHFGPSTGVTNASHRFFAGMQQTAAAPTDVNPSTLLRMFGIGYDAADTQVQFMHNDGTGAATKIALGASFPKPNADRAFTYRLEFYAPPGSTQALHYRATYLETGAVATGVITTDLPTTTELLQPHMYVSVGGVSSVVGIMVGKVMFGTEY